MKHGIVCGVVLLLCACSAEKPQHKQSNTQSPVIAKVNQHNITEAELNWVVNDTLGEFAALQLGADTKKKILESLIIKKLMVEQMQQSLDAEQQAEIALAMNVYRDELLAKRYIQEHITASPVSLEQAKHYYDNNLPQFGQRVIRRFAMVSAPLSKNNTQQSESLLREEAKQFDADSNWQHQAQQHSYFSYSAGHQAEKGLDPFYIGALKKLKPSDVSPVYTYQGKLVKFKLLTEQHIAAKPFTQVQNEIKKALAPINLKQAIKEEAARLSEQAQVTRYAMD
ncbi:peptidyl-prolyl cis-trans isomerase [Pseudoalteromonas sp. SW0106-04]|uniref:peptidylprolyl isomerase n=1 Tax=Pseudoalteromonas sp. SW0106-04 TaxID=1702169 RepID=UPI0006B68CDA|nr:peptidylprolyl isomerase [Pseudoalteromonas sp. SW0106-04]